MDLQLNDSNNLEEIEDYISSNISKFTKDELIKIKKFLVRTKAKKDMLFLAQNLLGYESSNKIHRELCDFLMSPDKFKLLLWPRVHGKTTIGSITNIVWHLINNPEKRILILSATEDVARGILANVKGHFTKNDKMREYFPEFCSKPGDDLGNRDFFDIPCKKKVTLEHSVYAAAIGSNLTGFHFDLQVKDDLVTELNSATPELAEGLDRNNNLTHYLKEPDAQELMIGTRYAFWDLYGKIIETDPRYKKSIRTVWTSPAMRYKETIWPEKWSLEDIMGILKSTGSAAFSAQMENDPVDPEAQVFRESDIQFISYKDLPPMNKYIFVDPALSLKTAADYTAVVVVGLDARMKVYVIEILRKKQKPLQTIEDLIQLYHKHDPVFVGIETQVFQRVIADWLRERCKALNLTMRIREVKRDDTETKHQRILGLQPKVENGMFFIVDNCPHKQDLVLEMVRYTMKGTKAQHDDMVDALSDIVQFGYPPRVYKVQNAVKRDSSAYWDQYFKKEKYRKGLLGLHNVVPT